MKISFSQVSIYIFAYLSLIFGKSKKQDIKLQDSKNILIIRLDGLGDITMTTSMLRELRNNCMDSNITLVVPIACIEIMQNCPYCDHILAFNSASKIFPHQLALFLKSIQFKNNNLKKKSFDYVLLPRTGSFVSAEVYIALLSGASNRVAYDSLLTINQNRKIKKLYPLFTHLLAANAKIHEVEANLRILSLMGLKVNSSYLELWPCDNDRKFIDGLISERCTYIAIGSNLTVAKKRNWPIDNYIQVINELLITYPKFRFILIGHGRDVINNEHIVMKCGNNVVNFAGRLKLGQTCSILERCKLFIGNDSGPMHLAAAMGVPVVEISCCPSNVEISHVNAPERFGPYGVPNEICRPLLKHKDCIQKFLAGEKNDTILDISISDVVSAADRLIQKLNLTK